MMETGLRYMDIGEHVQDPLTKLRTTHSLGSIHYSLGLSPPPRCAHVALGASVVLTVAILDCI